jgi:hypothetical protein
MGIRVGLFVFIAFAVAPGAQQTTRTGPRSVAGVVRDAMTLVPIAGARVRVAAFNRGGCDVCPASPRLPNAVTDSAGRFTIDDVPGTFALEADQTGYAQGGFGVRRPVGHPARIDLAPSQRLDDLDILLFREAVITGRVTDETGAPVAGIEVELSRIDARGRGTLPGSTSIEGGPVRSVTDAMGNYTAHVAPDEYAVAAIRGSVPAFHPSEDRLQSAALVTVEPGELLTGIHVQFPPRHVGLVRGRFPVPAEPQATRLRSSAWLRNSRFEIRGGFDGDTFVVDNVPYGDYSLEITSSRSSDGSAQRGPLLEWWARVPVRVDAATVEVNEVRPQRAFAVSGRITSPGAKTTQDWSRTGVQLLSADDGEHCGSRQTWNPVSTGGDFTVMTMPGRFRLCVRSHDRAGLEESTLNGLDIVDLPFTVGGDVRGLRVLQPAKPARLGGTILGRGGRPVREGWVVAFPFDRRYWAQAVAEGGRFAAARVSVAGAFQIDGLLPAEYVVAAVDDLSMDGWPMESWLESAAEGAVRITLGRGEARTLSPIKLRTIAVERAPVREYRRFIDGAFDVRMTVTRSDTVNFRLERVQRPSFAGEWTLDAGASSANGGGRGAVDTPGGGRGGGLGLGPSAESLDIRQTAESLSIEERRGRETARMIYRFDRSESIVLPAGRSAGTEAIALSRWQGSRLVTTITLPASAVGGATRYEETRWLEQDGTMVVEIRRPGDPNLRRTVYKRTR